MNSPVPASLKPGGGTLFGVVVGLLIGVLAAVIAIPRHSPVRVVSGPAGSTLEQGTTGGTTTGGVTSGTTGAATGGSATGGTTGTFPLPGTTTGGSTGTLPHTGTTGGSTGTTGATGTSGSTGGTTGPYVAPRGVTSKVIKLGVAYPDISALRALGAAYDNGNVPAQFQALVKGWEQRHVLPLAGRTIKLYFSKYNVLSADQQNATCRKLVEDDKVFAVIGVEYFQTGSDCVARQFHTPLITNDGPSDASLRNGAPYLYALNTSTGRDLRNWLYWARANGFLTNTRIGVYYSNADPISIYDAKTNVIGLLTKMGHAPVAIATTTQTTGGPADGIAARKFQGKHVNLALLLTSKFGFIDQAYAIHYFPHYIESDYLFGTSDTTTSNYVAQEWAGTYAMTATTEGAVAGGKPAGPGTAACIKNYEKNAHDTVAPATKNGHESAEYGYILAGCDEGDVFLAGLRAAGRQLTVARFIAGIKAIHDLHLRRVGTADFTRRDDGAQTIRTLRWYADCTCWRAISDYRRMYVE